MLLSRSCRFIPFVCEVGKGKKRKDDIKTKRIRPSTVRVAVLRLQIMNGYENRPSDDGKTVIERGYPYQCCDGDGGWFCGAQPENLGR